MAFPTLWNTALSPTMAAVGSVTGLAYVAMMGLTALALKTGPSGLTFAFQNAGSVFPAILLFLAFGPSFGFLWTYSQLVGITLVLGGLFLGARSTSNNTPTNTLKWLKYAMGCFAAQIVALTLIQGRCVFFNCDQLMGCLSGWGCNSADDVWFMPVQFAASLLFQGMIFWRERRRLQRIEILWGALGGVCNVACTFCLLYATKGATPFEKGILFPCFAAATIILCNLWAKGLYNEKFNVVSNTLCAAGILVGAL